MASTGSARVDTVRPGRLGLDLNPAIAAEIHSREPDVIARLRHELPPGGRALGWEKSCPPTSSCGLASPISELRLGRAGLEPVVVQAPLRPGRAACRAEAKSPGTGVIAARARLIESGVGAIVGGSPPPDGVFDRVEQVGRVWIGWLAAKPWADSRVGSRPIHRGQMTMAGPAFWSMPIESDTAHRARDMGPGMDGVARRQTDQNPGENRRFS